MHEIDVFKGINSISLGLDYSIDKIQSELKRKLLEPIPTRFYPKIIESELDDKPLIDEIIQPGANIVHSLDKSIEFAIIGEANTSKSVDFYSKCIDYLILEVLDAYSNACSDFELEFQCDRGYTTLFGLTSETDLKEKV